MASSIPDQYYSSQSDFTDNNLITTTNNPPNEIMISSSSLMEDNTTMCGDQQRYGGFVPFLLDNSFGAAVDDLHHQDHIVPSSSPSMHYYSDTWSPAAFPLEHHRANVPDVLDLQATHHNNFYGLNDGFHQSLLSYQQPSYNIGDFSDDCCALVEDIKPLGYHNNNKTSRDNWGIEGNNQVVGGVDQENIKVGRYSEEERKERILRYLKKRNQRNFNKTIKYACRKTLADRRVRVRGRFARNNELSEDEITIKKNVDNLQHYDLYGAADDSIQFQLRNEEEDWLEEAMESLVFLSHSSLEDI